MKNFQSSIFSNKNSVNPGLSGNIRALAALISGNSSDGYSTEYCTRIIILRHIKNMKAKSSSNALFLTLRSRHIGKFVHTTERGIIFSPNCGKIAVECDWNRKNSQSVQNLGFFAKIGFFFEKFFSKIATFGNFF